MPRIDVLLLAAGMMLMSGGAVSAAAEGTPLRDEASVQSCLEGVRDSNASDPDGKQASRDTCIGTVANTCLDEPQAQSTMDMVACYARETAVWDAMLNARYSALEDELGAESFKALRDTQRKWIAYRDAKCGLPYHFFEGGSIARPIAADCLNVETARRTNELGDYLDWLRN